MKIQRTTVWCMTIAALVILLGAGAARAAHFDIELTVESGGERAQTATAHADDSPPAEGHNPRPAVHARRDQPIVLQFFMTSAFPHGTRKGVTVHYYVVA